MITLPTPKKSRDYESTYKRCNNKEERCVECSRQIRKNKKYYCPKLNRYVSSNYVCIHFDRKPDYIKQTPEDRKKIHIMQNKQYNEKCDIIRAKKLEEIKPCRCLEALEIGGGEPKTRQKYKKDKRYYYRKMTNNERIIVYTLMSKNYNYKTSFTVEEFNKYFEVK